MTQGKSIAEIEFLITRVIGTNGQNFFFFTYWFWPQKVRTQRYWDFSHNDSNELETIGLACIHARYLQKLSLRVYLQNRSGFISFISMMLC